MDLDAAADFHARLSQIETKQIQDSRRITALELQQGGKKDELELFDNRTMGILVLLMVLPVILPMIGEMAARWKQSS